MLPIQRLDLILVQPAQFRIDIFLAATLVVCLHVDQDEERCQQGRTGRSQVEPIANGIVGRIKWEE